MTSVDIAIKRIKSYRYRLTKQQVEKQQPSSADINAAFEIFNYRYNNPHLLTIISSESTADEILQIDEAVGGRIFEKAVVLNLAPDMSRNYRLRKAVTV